VLGLRVGRFYLDLVGRLCLCCCVYCFLVGVWVAGDVLGLVVRVACCSRFVIDGLVRVFGCSFRLGFAGLA